MEENPSKRTINIETNQSGNTSSVYSRIIGYLGAPTTSQIEALNSIKKEVTRIKDDFNNFSETSEELLNKLLKDERKPVIKF